MPQEACRALQQQADESPEPLVFRTSRWLPGASFTQVLRLTEAMSKLKSGRCRSGEKKDFHQETEKIYSTDFDRWHIEDLHLKNTFPMLISGRI